MSNWTKDRVKDWIIILLNKNKITNTTGLEHQGGLNWTSCLDFLAQDNQNTNLCIWQEGDWKDVFVQRWNVWLLPYICGGLLWSFIILKRRWLLTFIRISSTARSLGSLSAMRFCMSRRAAVHSPSFRKRVHVWSQ